MAKTRILLVDDHTVMRSGLVSLLKTCPEIEVAGDAPDGKTGIDAALRLRPDVIVMDLLMPGMDGIEATRRLMEAWPEAKVLVLTTLETSDAFAQAMHSGAMGAILKTTDLGELREAISTVAAGRRFVSGEVEQIMRDDPPMPHLSPRQMQILHLAARGLSNGDISRIVGISAPVVGEHLKAVFAKLGVANRTEAVAIAIRKHILDD